MYNLIVLLPDLSGFMLVVATSYLAAHLDRVSDMMQSIGHIDGDMDDSTRYIINNVTAAFNKGKCLRPIVALLVGQIFGAPSDNCVTLAAASELIHMATLLHDDVIDSSSMRRGCPTVNRIFDNKTSVLSGDFFLGSAFNMLLSLQDITILQIMTRCTMRMVRGELSQMAFNGNYDMTLENYLHVLGAKTASLFSAIAESSARISGASASQIDKLADFGYNFGIAFQIFDDIIDYGYSREPRSNAYMGKPLGADFYNGIVTLPAIIAISLASKQERLFWIKTFSDSKNRTSESFIEATKYIAQHSAIDKALNVAESYATKACNALACFSASVAKDMLFNLAKFAVERSY